LKQFLFREIDVLSIQPVI